MPAALVKVTSFQKQGPLSVNPISRTTNVNLFADVAAMSSLNPKQVLALRCWYCMNSLYSYVGNSLDYRTDQDTLKANAALLLGGFGNTSIMGDFFDKAMAAVEYSEAVTTSAAFNNSSLSTSIETQLVSIQALDNLPMDQLRLLYLTLRYLLSVNLT